jgi:HlyD family secretion protein
MSCNAKIETKTLSNVFSVPIQSITARNTKELPKPENEDANQNSNKKKENPATAEKIKEIVFVVKDNKVKTQDVTTGISDDNYIEVTSGLTGKEEVVSGPYRAISKDLQNGSTVKLDKHGKTETASK